MASDLVDDKKGYKNIIFEYCAQKKLAPPRWDSEELSKTPCVFRSVVSVNLGNAGEIKTSEGLGSSKKDAEQSAAFKIIGEILSTKELLMMTMTSSGKYIVTEDLRLEKERQKKAAALNSSSAVDSDDDEDVASDYEEDRKITGEPIQNLSTTCANFKLPAPDYTETHKYDARGKPIHKIKASVGDLATQSVRRRKKQAAKKAAAFLVLQELKNKGYDLAAKKTKLAASQPQHSSSRKSDEVSSSQESNDLELSRKRTISLATDNLEHSALKGNSASSDDLDVKPVKEKKIDLAVVSTRKRHSVDAVETEEELGSSEAKIMKIENGHPSQNHCSDLNVTECCQLIKDFAQSFQHLPPSSVLDDILKSGKVDGIDEPLKCLEQLARDIGAKISILHTRVRKTRSSSPDSESPSYLTTIKLTVNSSSRCLKSGFKKSHSASGYGDSKVESSNFAARTMVKYLHEMMSRD